MANPLEGRLLRRDDGVVGAGVAGVGEGELVVLVADQVVARGKLRDANRKPQISANIA